ncbi:hypothetical protein QYF61_017586 [Mycteria americana]|uniref:Uncharacterized protein n=1 Tax=Mycteria americana TaxID=33587 RepID=A0AAN7MWS7_MYCAM|nr:hypothetical protein QYF61_017586 [Mycteria americana]
MEGSCVRGSSEWTLGKVSSLRGCPLGHYPTLPREVATAPSLSEFKERLDNALNYCTPPTLCCRTRRPCKAPPPAPSHHARQQHLPEHPPPPLC